MKTAVFTFEVKKELQSMDNGMEDLNSTEDGAWVSKNSIHKLIEKKQLQEKNVFKHSVAKIYILFFEMILVERLLKY